jgi:hypothetical protein
MNEQPEPKAYREYGELFFHSSVVTAILHMVALSLEGDKRDAMLQLSHSFPTTMPWAPDSTHVQQQTNDYPVCRPVQLRIRDNALFGANTLRPTALLRNGPSHMYSFHWEHSTGVADEQQDAKPCT